MKLATLSSCLLLHIYLSEAQNDYASRQNRSISLGDGRPNFRLNGYEVATYNVRSHLQCTMLCNQNSACVSINICANRLCTLNSAEVTKCETHPNLIEDANCDYFGRTSTKFL